MALQVGISATGPGVVYDLGNFDDIVVTNGANIVSTTDIAIAGQGNDHSVTVNGHVFGDFIGIDLGLTQTSFGQDVYIAENASVGSILNDDTAGVRVRGSISSVVNNGDVSGYNGIVFGGEDNGGISQIVNYGTISATSNAVIRFGGTFYDETTIFTNFGNVFGVNAAFEGNFLDATDIVHNRGTMIGDVNLGAGNDVYDGRGGTIDGRVNGDDGNDTFYVGESIEFFDGGDGVDAINFRSSQEGITLALDGLFGGEGVATGDTYINIENIFGSVIGDDYLRGNSLDNFLIGEGGNDTLLGVGGNDYFRGGRGADTMVGGAGNDSFQYLSFLEGGDTIADFTNVVGNNDLFRIDASGFGGGLTTGFLAANQFQSRTDNQAQDADDRFIFRTTDSTLWYDINGDAAGGLYLLADLQDTAVITESDIFLF